MLATSHVGQARELATYDLQGIQLRTGDIICTTDGHEGLFFGFAYLALGMLVPGPIDHNIMYIGPGPRFVEAGIRGPIVFSLRDGKWGGMRAAVQRLLLDRLYGVADPTAGRGLSAEQERRVRLAAADYCLLQARIGRPYNPNFFNPYTERAFYCSQLIYLAYLRQGIHLRTTDRLPGHPWLGSIVFPTDLWEACHARQQFTR